MRRRVVTAASPYDSSVWSARTRNDRKNVIHDHGGRRQAKIWRICVGRLVLDQNNAGQHTDAPYTIFDYRPTGR
jgi:hypothetical protein